MKIENFLKNKIFRFICISLVFCMLLPLLAACDKQDLPTLSVASDPTEDNANLPTEQNPTSEPTQAPTEPTQAPTEPTQAPTSEPTQSPTEPTQAPTSDPTQAPTEPTQAPTSEPTQAPTEPTEDPTSEPTEAPTEPGVNYEGIVISKVFGTGGKVDAAMRDSFIELYNPTLKTASLSGTSLYYGEGESYIRLDLSGIKIAPETHYLIKCASVDGYDTNFEVLRIDNFDREWGITIDNKAFELIYCRSDYTPTPSGNFEVPEVYSYVVAHAVENVNVNFVNNLSKNRVIVKTDMNLDGYHKVNLIKSGTAELEKITPVSSAGNVNTYVKSNFSEVIFSKEGCIIRQSSLSLELYAPEGWTIYYTLNGDDPRTNGKKYTEELKLSSMNSMNIYDGETFSYANNISNDMVTSSNTFFGGVVVKAYATNGTESTAVYTQSYFLSSDLAKLGAKVVSISLPKEDLFDPANRVYYNFDTFGTRNRARAFIEIFDGKTRTGGVYGEIAVSGVGSSGLPMKSLRLYLKDPLDENDPAPDSFEYDLFDGKATNSLGQAITSFDRLLLRNGGNDFNITMLRDVYAQSMSGGLNVDRLEYTPVLVFINGEFWEMYNLRERYSPEYFNRHYGVLEDNVVIIENESPLKYDASKPESWNTDYVASTGNEAVPHDIYAKEFNELVGYIRSHDLSVQEYFDYVAERLDIDSFIDYWIINTYFCNPDWPGNNIKVWRNLDPNDPSGMDTKWRFILVDMDSSVAYPQAGGYPNTLAYWDKFNDIAENTRCGAIMYGLCKNVQFREKFVSRTRYVVDEYFTYEKCAEKLDEMQKGIKNLIKYQFMRYASHGNVNTWSGSLEVMKDFLANRREYYLSHLDKHFN